MTVIGVDPSSTLTGCAVMTQPDRLVDLWLFAPHDRRAAACKRIDDMVTDLISVIKIVRVVVRCPNVMVVIEVPDGKVNHNRHKGRGAGLSIYGQAAGEMRRALMMTPSVQCVAVTPGQWVPKNERGNPIDKGQRVQLAAAKYPGFADAIVKNKGGDLADAIGLAQYGFDIQRQIELGAA